MGSFILLAFKNVFRQKKRSITLGVNYAIVAAILVLLLSFSRGASQNISTSLVNATAGHLTVTGQFAADGKIFIGLRHIEDIERAVVEALVPLPEQSSGMPFSRMSMSKACRKGFPSPEYAPNPIPDFAIKLFLAKAIGILLPPTQTELQFLESLQSISVLL
jgi:hypothetical protein